MLKAELEFKKQVERKRRERLLNAIGNLIDYVRYSINEEIDGVLDSFLAEKGVESFIDLDNETLEEFIYVLLDVLESRRE